MRESRTVWHLKLEELPVAPTACCDPRCVPDLQASCKQHTASATEKESKHNSKSSHADSSYSYDRQLSSFHEPVSD